MLRITELRLPLDHAEPALRAAVLARLGLADAPWPLGVLAIVLLGSVVPAAGIRWPPFAAMAAGLLAGLLYVLAVQLAFEGGTILPLLYPLLGLLVAVVGTLGVHYLLAAFERQRARMMFERFVPPGVVDEVMGRADDDLRLGGQKKVCTVMFSDVRGFTAIAESRGPDQVVEILNRYLGELVILSEALRTRWEAHRQGAAPASADLGAPASSGRGDLRLA